MASIGIYWVMTTIGGIYDKKIEKAVMKVKFDFPNSPMIMA